MTALERQRLRFIPLAELAMRTAPGPDSTVSRQVAIRRLLRSLNRELRACQTVEVAAEDVSTFRSMQSLHQLSKGEATLQRYHDEVATAWTIYQLADDPAHRAPESAS